MTLAPGTRLGPYEILGRIGAGGMGEVWKAKDTRLDRLVAVKVLPEHLAQHPESLVRFEREAKAVAALNHPNILGLFDIGNSGDTVFAVMELLEGETLRDRLASGPLPPRKATELAIQVAQGLAAAHEKGVVHRDLKPENLWITKDGRLKILDFGLAKQFSFGKGGQSETPTQAFARGSEPGAVLGTVGYMSPEQVRGEPADHHSDIFSFGVVLYEMLTGRRAFAKDTAAETMTAILLEEPPDPEAGSWPLPPGLQHVVQHCLEKDPAHRFQDAHDLAFALGNLSSGSSSSASITAPFAPRNRRTTAVWAALAAALFLLLGVGLERWTGKAPALPTFRKLTYGRGAIDGARFVPGSRDILYSARWQGDLSTVFLLREGSGEPRTLEGKDALLLGASPQATAILTRPMLYNGLLEGTVSLLPLAGGGAREVSRAAVAADFPADGSSLCLVTRSTSFGYQLEWPPGEVLLKSNTVLGGPRIHGSRVALFKARLETGTEGELLVVAKGEAPRALAQCKGITALAWGPGEEVWFSTFDGGESLIRAVSLNGRVRILARHPGRLELVDVDPAGRCLAIASSHMRQAFGRALGANRDADLTWLNAQVPQGLSRDGHQVLLTPWGDWEMFDRGGLYLRPLEGGPAVQVGTGSQAAALSADGRWVVTYAPDGKGETGLRLIPTAAGASRWFSLKGHPTNGDGLWFHPTTGKICFIDTKKYQINSLDPASGAIAPGLIPPSVTFYSGQIPFAADGRRSLWVNADFTAPEEDPLRIQLMLYEGEGTRPRPARGNLNTEAVAGWDAAGREVFLYDRNAIPAEVVRWNPDTGARRSLLKIAPPDPSGIWGIQFLYLAPSGQAYAYSVVRKLSDLYLIEGLK